MELFQILWIYRHLIVREKHSFVAMNIVVFLQCGKISSRLLYKACKNKPLVNVSVNKMRSFIYNVTSNNPFIIY